VSKKRDIQSFIEESNFKLKDKNANDAENAAYDAAKKVKSHFFTSTIGKATPYP
jgi:hypothetical protein